MKKLNKKIDERQELELLKIGNFSFWFLFLSLSLSIIIQVVLFDVSASHIAAEFICLIIGTVSIIGSCIVKGQWGTFTKPSIKAYFATSLITAITYIIITIARAYFITDNIDNLSPYVFLRAISVFSFVFVILVCCGSIVKKRAQALEKKYEDVD